MIKSILVCTDGSPHGDAACEYAIDFARKLYATLTALHVLDSRMLEGPFMADVSGWVGAQPYGEQLQQFRVLMQQKGEAVIEAFNARCAAAGVQAATQLSMGHPIHTILQAENQVELLVMGQKGEHAEWGGEMMGSTAERVVRHSVKPCLVTPETFKPVSRILAAYDGSAHSSQALHEAIELATALKTPLSIMTVAEDKDLERANQITREGLQMAQAHQCPATHLVAKGPPAPALLNMAAEHQFDLLVMGAYGHSRIREMIVGSTTAQLVSRSPIPVMLVR